MAVPKQKTSKARKNQRRANKGLTSGAISVCSQCGETKTPHRVCKSCGFYRGKKVIEVNRSSQ
jgi:large subunit ribosomal protein L32